MRHEEAWARFVGRLSKDKASEVGEDLAVLRYRRATQFNCEAAEYIIFVSTGGREVLQMPDVSEVGFR